MVEDFAFSHRIEYVEICYDILNLKGHHNRTTSSRVTAIFLNGLILPIGGGSAINGATTSSFINLPWTKNKGDKINN